MKHYEEMAQRVLEQIEIKKRQRRRRTPLIVGAVLVCCLLVFGGLKTVFVLPGPYMGPTMDTSYCWLEPSLEDFYRKPDYIVQGTVTAVKEDYFLNPLDLRNRPNAKITVYEMTLDQTFKGHLPGETVLVKVMNGEYVYTAWYDAAVKAGDIDEYRLEIGKSYILGLKTVDFESPYYEMGDLYIYYREAMTFTQNEKGQWQSSWDELIFDSATLRQAMNEDAQKVLEEASLIVKGTVQKLNRTYYTDPEGDGTLTNSFVKEYTIEVQEALKGNFGEKTLALRAYDLHGGIIQHEYYQKEIEEGQYPLFTLEKGTEYILCLTPISEKEAKGYGDDAEGYRLATENNGSADCDYLYRACFRQDADGLWRNLADGQLILDPKALTVQ